MHTYDELQPYDSEPAWDPGGNPFHFVKEKKGWFVAQSHCFPLLMKHWILARFPAHTAPMHT